MLRVLEPEVMSDEDEVSVYAAADFSGSNQEFVSRLVGEFPHALRRVVDLGCGTADVPIRLARASQGSHITALDASPEMLKYAQSAVSAAGFGERIDLHQGYLPGAALPDHSFDAVLSKDMLHHLPDPGVLWSEARRLARPGALVFVMDLIRPDSTSEAREIVERVSRDEAPLLKRGFYESLLAAFTVEEVAEQLARAGLSFRVERIGDRHLLVRGTCAETCSV